MGHKIGRNQACPCGSGLKYKACCGGSNLERERRLRSAFRVDPQAVRYLIHRFKQKQMTLIQFDAALKEIVGGGDKTEHLKGLFEDVTQEDVITAIEKLSQPSYA